MYQNITTTLFKTSHLHLQSEFQLCRSLKEFCETFVIWIQQELFKSDGSGILQEILEISEVNSRRILYQKYRLLFERRIPPSPFDSTNFFIMYIYYDVIIVVYDLFVCSRYDFIIYS